MIIPQHGLIRNQKAVEIWPSTSNGVLEYQLETGYSRPIDLGPAKTVGRRIRHARILQ